MFVKSRGRPHALNSSATVVGTMNRMVRYCTGGATGLDPVASYVRQVRWSFTVLYIVECTRKENCRAGRCDGGLNDWTQADRQLWVKGLNCRKFSVTGQRSNRIRVDS